MNKINKFIEKNQNINLKHFNFLDQAAIENLNFDEESDKSLQLAHLMGYQRMLRLTDCEETAEALIELGIHSVLHITDLARSRFIELYAHICKPKLNRPAEEQAALIYDLAIARRTQLIHTYVAIHQHNSGYYK